MGSIGLPSLLPQDMASSMTRPPELADPRYIQEVLAEPSSRTEDDVDASLAAKAAELGIDVAALDVIPPPRAESPKPSTAESAPSVTTRLARSNSTTSNATTSTDLTSRNSMSLPATLTETSSKMARRRSKTLSFSQYDKYLDQVDPTLTQPKFLPQCPPKRERAGSVFSMASRVNVKDLKRGIAVKLRWKKKPGPRPGPMISCVCCREDFDSEEDPPQTLPCGHTYCRSCVMVMVTQSMTDESKMPPRCCTQPIPGSIVRSVLARDDQQKFLRAVLEYSTPWESRIFCPNTSCGEFIPPRSKLDPKHPFEVMCKSCRTKVCITCKRNGHRLGQDCPEDWELDTVLKMGESSGWRRCYKCRTLVELAQGCTHMTCRCKAQFCYICGAVWNPIVGCPNFCNGEEELERRRMEEELREAELEAKKEAEAEAAAREEVERLEADKRTRQSAEFKDLRAEQTMEMERFRKFEHKMKWHMWTRQSQKRLAVVEKYTDMTEKMKERHDKTEQHLEDRQLEAEVELRATLAQSERSINIQLRHMEAYCNGLGRSLNSEMPDREVTQKHLEQLGHQYHLRDGMERRHQAQINVLREKQSKAMEELTVRQDKEMEKLDEKKTGEFEALDLEFANEEEALVRGFEERKERIQKRWRLAIEVLRKELEKRDDVRYGTAPLPEWPRGRESQYDSLPSVSEEDI